jgi:GTP-binding protein
MEPLFQLLLRHVAPYPDVNDEPLQLQISSLGYDDYIGRLGIGRIRRGTLKKSGSYVLSKRDGSRVFVKINQVFINQGLRRVEVEEARAGDIVTFSGVSHVSIGETLSAPEKIEALPMIPIEEPTLAIQVLVNDGPFVGRSGTYVTTRQLRARLMKELETNVGLKVEELTGTDGYLVSGRGELHLSILLENMRREGYELCVSKPEVLFQTIDGVVHEPYEQVVATMPDAFAGAVIQALNQNKGTMRAMKSEDGYTRIEYLVPTRGLLGYRSQFINTTRGQGTLEKTFEAYHPYAGAIDSTRNGVFIAKEAGVTMAYSLFHLSDRGRMIVGPATPVYEGMIVGIHSRQNDLVVNPCKNKHLSNVRSSGSDEALKLSDPLRFTLEEALAFLAPDELLEITPDAIRMRKRILVEHERRNDAKRLKNTSL